MACNDDFRHVCYKDLENYVKRDQYFADFNPEEIALIQKNLGIDTTDKDDENKVIEVSIDGNTQFSSTDRYPNYSHVEIVYHTLKEASTPVSAKDAKGMDYKELAGLYKDAGFVNVSYEKEADLITGWITKENSVKSISIDGDSDFSEDVSYRIDAEIVITYHTFK